MHQNDLELVKLLHQNCTEAEERLSKLTADLDQTKADLEAIEESASSRKDYSDILKQVADALDRQDLVVELPDSSELSAKCEELGRDVERATEDAKRYRQLLDELTDRAPGLLEAAGLNPLPRAEQPVEDSGIEPDARPVDDASADGEAGAENDTEDDQSPDSSEPPASSLKFNLKTIKRREKTGHGPGAVYIIDGNSVVSRIPAYDFSQRAVDETLVYEELANDLTELGEEITGSFCILSESPLTLDKSISSAISFVSPGNNGSGETEDRLHFLLRLADEYTGRLRNVCVVSGDDEVLSQVQNRGMHTMGLSEFFLT